MKLKKKNFFSVNNCLEIVVVKNRSYMRPTWERYNLEDDIYLLFSKSKTMYLDKIADWGWKIGIGDGKNSSVCQDTNFGSTYK